MNTPTTPGSGTRLHPWRLRSPAMVFGRRTALAGALGLAVGAALRPSPIRAVTRPTAGATIYSYGHSYARMPNPYVGRKAHDEYQLELGRRLGSGRVVSHGRSGLRLLDAVSALIAPPVAGSVSHQWQIGDQGIVLLHAMMNDVASSGGGHPDYLNAYEKALRLALGVFGARSFTHADSASRVGGGWTPRGSDRVESGHSWSTRTWGDQISFQVTGGDSVHVSTLCTDPHQLSQGTLRAECGGVVLGYFGRSPDHGRYVCNRGQAYTDSVNRLSQNWWTPAGWRINGLDAAAGTGGAKVVTLLKVDRTESPVWVQGVYAAAENPPRVLVAKEPPRNPAAPGRAAVAAFYAHEPSYRELIDGVCGEYRSASQVDLRQGWDNATMVSARDLRSRFHPNALGMSCIADSFEDALARRT